MAPGRVVLTVDEMVAQMVETMASLLAANWAFSKAAPSVGRKDVVKVA